MPPIMAKYQAIIEKLRKKKEYFLLIQALHELGYFKKIILILIFVINKIKEI